MQILIFNWRDPKNPLSGGAEIVTHTHAKAWAFAGHSVTWFSSSFPGAKDHELLDGVTIIRRGNPYTVHIAALFYALFSRVHFDLVIDEIHGLPFYTPVYLRIPKIAFIHEVAGEIWDTMTFFPLNVIGKRLELWSFRLYRNVLWWTDAPSTIDELVEYGIDRSKCIAIPCPPGSPVLSKLPQKEKQPTLLFVSRLVPMKGIEEVLKAFTLLPRNLRARLWIVGEGKSSYMNFLRSIAPRSVRFYGKVTESKKLALMRRAHILLHASVKEGWGLVVVEAASQGTPAVVYNVPGLRDSVKNGKTGIVVVHNTPQDMAREVMTLLKDGKRYRTYQTNCLKWAKSLSWDRATKESLDLLERARKN